MVVYDKLSKVAPFRKKYSLKFLAIAFIGIHVPLIGMGIFFAVSSDHPDLFTTIVFMLGLTLFATFCTLSVLNKLLAPLQLASKSLNSYLEDRIVPELPMHYEDEAGVLLADIGKTIGKLDHMVVEKTGVIDLLSHDLRSPMARIIGLSQVQKIDQENGNNNKYTDEIIAECNHALALLADVIHILRQEEMTGKSIPLVKTSLKEIVTKSACAFDIRSSEKKISWAINVDEDQQLEVEPTLFTQAVKNVMNNAVKFSLPGSTIYIDSKLSGSLLYMSIKDEGIGFDMKDSEAIFLRFTKLGRKGTQGEASTGLGLFLSKKIMQRHGGDLIAESNGPGSGATFTFIIPFK
jgi:signal transduction histidine kinase